MPSLQYLNFKKRTYRVLNPALFYSCIDPDCDPDATATAATSKGKSTIRAACNICQKNILVQNLELHKRRMHSTAEKKEAMKPQCLICNKRVWWLKRHMQIHISSDPERKQSHKSDSGNESKLLKHPPTPVLAVQSDLQQSQSSFIDSSIPIPILNLIS